MIIGKYEGTKYDVSRTAANILLADGKMDGIRFDGSHEGCLEIMRRIDNYNAVDSRLRLGEELKYVMMNKGDGKTLVIREKKEQWDPHKKHNTRSEFSCMAESMGIRYANAIFELGSHFGVSPSEVRSLYQERGYEKMIAHMEKRQNRVNEVPVQDLSLQERLDLYDSGEFTREVGDSPEFQATKLDAKVRELDADEIGVLAVEYGTYSD